jgi:hypothetical protein
VGIVGEHEHGPRLRELPEHGERAGADEMALRGRGRREAERAAQRFRLRRRQPLERAEHGREQRVQPGERELDLGLDAPHAEHGGVPGRGGRVLGSAVLPIPGSPRSTSTPLRPSRAPVRSASIRARSASRPSSMPPIVRARGAAARR